MTTVNEPNQQDAPTQQGELKQRTKPLSEHDLSRYARHLTLPGFGGEKQKLLRAAKVLVVGAGGLGSPVLLYLAAAGIGHITIIDDDVVDESNLQRQVIHRQEDLGRPKAESARDAILRLDSECSVRAIVDRLSPDNALELFASHDAVIDGADNFATRYLSNDAAELTGTPLVWATISQFDGQLSVFWPGRGPMLRDLYPEIPDPDSVPSCAAGGVLGAMVGMVGSMIAVETIKVLTGIGEAAIGRLMLIDSLALSVRNLRFKADPDREPVTDLTEVVAACSLAATTAAEDRAAEEARASYSPWEVQRLLADAPGAAIKLIDVREKDERDAGFIEPSVHIPLAEIEAGGWQRLAKDLGLHLNDGDNLVIYCHSGRRSAKAIDTLKADSSSPNRPEHISLHNVDGGIVAWREGPGTA